MTINDDFDNDDTAGQTGTPGDGNAAATLRKQNAKLAADLKARDEELAKLRSAQKTTTIAEALKANGGKAAWAKYAAQEIEGDVTPESVRKWLETSAAEAFDWTAPEADEPDEDEIANREASRRVSAATRTAPAGDTAINAQRLKTASVDELRAWGIIQ